MFRREDSGVEMLRMQLLVKGKHYYDVGLRGRMGNDKLSKTNWRFGEECPRFLEDFIEKYGKKNVEILSFGDMSLEDKAYALNLLK